MIDYQPALKLSKIIISGWAAFGLGKCSISRPTQRHGMCSASAANIVFQSTDGGQSWQDVSAGLPVDFGVGRVFADGGNVFLVSDGGLYHRSSVSLAPEWEKDWFLNESVSDVYPGSAGLYASSYQTVFFQKLPGTDIWKPMHNALKYKTVRTVLETSNGNIFVGCESGIFGSSDWGKTWELMRPSNGKTLINLAVSGHVIYAVVVVGC